MQIAIRDTLLPLPGSALADPALRLDTLPLRGAAAAVLGWWPTASHEAGPRCCFFYLQYISEEPQVWLCAFFRTLQQRGAPACHMYVK